MRIYKAYPAAEGMVALYLDGEEAQFLADISIRIGGNSADTRRIHADSLQAALREIGVFPEYYAADIAARGNIVFKPIEPSLAEVVEKAKGEELLRNNARTEKALDHFVEVLVRSTEDLRRSIEDGKD